MQAKYNLHALPKSLYFIYNQGSVHSLHSQHMLVFLPLLLATSVIKHRKHIQNFTNISKKWKNFANTILEFELTHASKQILQWAEYWFSHLEIVTTALQKYWKMWIFQHEESSSEDEKSLKHDVPSRLSAGHGRSDSPILRRDDKHDFVNNNYRQRMSATK